jgi:hypothetical protein
MGVLRYRVGNENDPGDPWGRSELVIQPDGAARLDHRFSRGRADGAWTGRVDAAALDALWSALQQARFPAAPTTPSVPGAAPRHIVVERGESVEQAIVGYHEAAGLPGYAQAFDLLDAIIRQLSADEVPYPTGQSRTIVSEVAAVDR